METLPDLIQLLDATLRVAVPQSLCAMAGVFSERSGIVDISLEGKMLVGAFAAASVAWLTGSAWIGLLAAMLVSMSFSALHGFACVTHNGNHVVSGVAINILAAGLTIVLGIAFFRAGGRTPSLQFDERFTPVTLPLAETLSGVPLLGSISAELISGHTVLVYAAFALVAAVWFTVYRTRFGLRLRAVGESPAAVDTAGISVARLRYQALLVNGALCGIAGTYLATAQSAAFIKDMTAGKGFIALAALIFGKWRPVPAMLACLLFGFLEALAARMQGFLDPSQVAEGVLRELVKGLPFLIEALPYILVVLLLAGFVGKAIAPKAIGEPYIKER